MAGESKVAVVAALVANFLIAVLKLVAGFISGSAAMFAEAAHSFSDVGNQILLLVGISRASKPPSPKHPYGTSKAAYFWPFLVAVLLFGVAGGYSFLEGIEKIRHPHPLEDVRLALGVLAVAFVIEIVSLAIAVREAKKGAKARGIVSVKQFLEENRDATLLTVLVEDGLALAGLPIAALAIVLTLVTGNPMWDGIGSIVIGLLLMGFALFLGYEVQHLIVGRGLSGRDLAKVQAVLVEDPAVTGVVNVQSMYLGPDVVLLGAEVDLRDDLRGSEVEASLARLEARLIQAVPALKFVYLEPADVSKKDETGRVTPHTAHGPT